MARGSKGVKKGGASDKAKPSEVKKVISGSKLKNLMAAKRSAKKDTAEIAGQLGQMIRDAVENNHLHRKAFGTIVMLDNMEPEKVLDFLDHFNYYLDVSGIQKKAEAAPRLPMGDGPGEEGEEESEGDNVHKFPAAAE